MGALKPQSMGPLCSNTRIGKLALDGWAVTFDIVRRVLNRLRPCPLPSTLLTVLNVSVHPSTVSVPTSYYLMWHYNYL